MANTNNEKAMRIDLVHGNPLFTVMLDSSAITSIGYYYKTETLMVSFTSGAEYIYEDVPLNTFAALASAESAGRFFQKSIRGAYNYQRVA